MRYQAALRPDSKYSNRLNALSILRCNIFIVHSTLRQPFCQTTLCPYLGWNLVSRFRQWSGRGVPNLMHRACWLREVT